MVAPWRKRRAYGLDWDLWARPGSVVEKVECVPRTMNRAVRSSRVSCPDASGHDSSRRDSFPSHSTAGSAVGTWTRPSSCVAKITQDGALNTGRTLSRSQYRSTLTRAVYDP